MPNDKPNKDERIVDVLVIGFVSLAIVGMYFLLGGTVAWPEAW